MKAIKNLLVLVVLLFILAACVPQEVIHTEYVLTTDMRDGKFVFLGVDDSTYGMVNPDLHAERGERITVMLINRGEGKHDIVLPDINIESGTINKKGETTSITFTVPDENITLEYSDSTHEHLGMKGELIVGELAVEIIEEPAPEEPAEEELVEEEPVDEKPAGLYDTELALSSFQKGGCGACHRIPGVPGALGTIGPDLSEVGAEAQTRIESGEYAGISITVVDYLYESIESPDAFISPSCPDGPCTPGTMPASLALIFSDNELDAVVNYLAEPPEGAVVDADSVAPIGDMPQLTAEEFDWAKQTFFERCAGCHGTLRKGATGPALTPDVTLPQGTIGLAAIIFNGTPRGMPDWGKQGDLTQEQTEIMAKYLQNEPPIPPEFSLQQMKDSWQLITPLDQRPTEPQTTRDWQNYFSVTLRDAGQVAIIDGDTYEVVNTVDSGYAVHITRMSASGRYAYVIGRDGRLALIDLWMEKPEVVARVQTCYDARSVEVSKYEGPEGDFRDQYAIAGCYWPPHFAILDGQTLEPVKVVSSRSYTFGTGEYHPEPRVASILASHFKPEWIVNIKETGQIWIVNYTDPINPSIKMINSALFLHDGGLDSTHRYFLVAANQSNKIAVVDLQEGNLAGLVGVGAVPHPGRGANWIDPVFGPVWSTGHLGEAAIMSVGTDPEGHPDQAWKNVRTIELPGSGSLFIKTHPTSQWIWIDMTLNPDPALARTICVIAKADPSKVHKCWEIGTYGRAVHFEYNKQGTEVWVSLWGSADKPGEVGEIVVYDDATLVEVARIPDLITPTGKFNVYNTVNDIY